MFRDENLMQYITEEDKQELVVRSQPGSGFFFPLSSRYDLCGRRRCPFLSVVASYQEEGVFIENRT